MVWREVISEMHAFSYANKYFIMQAFMVIVWKSQMKGENHFSYLYN